MRLDHPDYIKLVIAAYNKKKATNELSPLLAQSTPANIRRECATVYQERFDKKDEPMLRAFFGHAEQGRKFQAFIEHFDVDKFRPLDSYLKEEGKKSITDRNLYLLAWLIDFKHRPYNFGMEVILNEEELSIIRGPIGDPLSPPPPKPGTVMPGVPAPNGEEPEISLQTALVDGKKKGTVKKAIAIFLIGVISLGGLYFFWQQDKDRQRVMGNVSTNCMYWAQDHYEPVSCNEKGKGLLVPLNRGKMKSFRKITRKDTITEWSIGKLYYIKNNNDIECYTEGGNYPEEPNRTLKVLSRYIFDKYLGKRILPVSDSVSIKDTNAITKR